MLENKVEPYVQLAAMSRWYVVSRALHTVAKLGLANHMSDAPVNVYDLAHLTNTKPELLDRLLKFLSDYKIFQDKDGGYTLTELSEPLRDDNPHSLRAALCMVDENWWQSFSCLEKCLHTGNSGFFEMHGDDFFSFLSKSPQRQENFDKGMAKLSDLDNKSIATAFNFGQFKSVTDLGGGRGGLVKTMVETYPALELTLFDTESVIKALDVKNFPQQVTLKAGSFFEIIPDTDAYIFKGVLHDFNDKDMHDILTNCSKQMSSRARLFLAEQVMPDNSEPHPNKTMDIVMMVLLGGRQRTLDEWQKCIEPAGLTFLNSYKTQSIFTLMEFKRCI